MIDIYGTDIKSDWSFTNGDINLVSGHDNMGQAIKNRLESDLDTYDLFYLEYGGELFEHMGDKNNPRIHEYIRIEIEHILDQEPRIDNLECTVTKTDKDTIECKLKIKPVQSERIDEFNLVINEDSYIEITGTTSEINEVRI